MKNIINDYNHLGHFSLQTHKLSHGDHLCKLYRDDHNLSETFCDYVVPGITRGDGIIIIATSQHRNMFQKALERRSIDVTKAQASGQLIMLDAQEVMDKFIVNGSPNPAKFKKAVSGVIKKVQSKHPIIRAYGEMVNVMWEDRNTEGAIQLERLWNDLAKDHSFTLLCAYDEEKFHTNGSAQSVHHVCRAHTHIISATGELKMKPQFA